MSFELMTFGGRGINLAGLKAATDYFIGKVYDVSSNTKTSASAAKGLDYGSEHGTYKTKVTVSVRDIKKIVSSKADTLEIGFMESKDDTTFTETMTLKVKIADINEARRTPIVFTPISTCSRYFCLRLKFTGGSSSNSDSITDGMILATAEPDTY